MAAVVLNFVALLCPVLMSIIMLQIANVSVEVIQCSGKLVAHSRLLTAIVLHSVLYIFERCLVDDINIARDEMDVRVR